ncbi:hypothetical protein [Methylobacterium sp. SyP6R]|uniref:hypothetical protein n=1 Tax=Methylobacterium sp. SyP6R TaxID=2718876 RepID=UPI001F3DEB0B|nr:hypothetical protein [Methylobacterium sp. SyP6R]MCF4125546.1 hypothetical protein [Methylobacterium sp. SyP6R]
MRRSKSAFVAHFLLCTTKVQIGGDMTKMRHLRNAAASPAFLASKGLAIRDNLEDHRGVQTVSPGGGRVQHGFGRSAVR